MCLMEFRYALFLDARAEKLIDASVFRFFDPILTSFSIRMRIEIIWKYSVARLWR